MEHFDGSTAPTEHSFTGIYIEITAPERLVFTVGIIPSRPDPVTTLIFSEEAGKTKLTMTIECKSVGDRDALLQMRIDVGAARTLANLDRIDREDLR